MEVNKKGIWKTSPYQMTLLVNNFGETGTLTDWTTGGTLDGKTLVLSGQSPAITSKAFTVQPDDIIVVEFSVAFTTLSDGSGVYLGSQSSTNTNRFFYNFTTGQWGEPQSNASSQWDTYWLTNYNSQDRKTVRSYILGSNVDITRVPAPEGTDRAIQLGSGNTSTYVRAGYNANTNMVYNIYEFKIYNILDEGLTENKQKAKIKQSCLSANSFVEI